MNIYCRRNRLRSNIPKYEFVALINKWRSSIFARFFSCVSCVLGFSIHILKMLLRIFRKTHWATREFFCYFQKASLLLKRIGPLVACIEVCGRSSDLRNFDSGWGWKSPDHRQALRCFFATTETTSGTFAVHFMQDGLQMPSCFRIHMVYKLHIRQKKSSFPFLPVCILF